MSLEPRKAAADPPPDRLPCDPAAVVLPVISALGAIAAIAVMPFVAEDRTPERGRSRRRPTSAVRDLETDCLQLQEICRRLQRTLRSAPGGQAVAASPLKFGLYGVDLADASLVAEIARVLGAAVRDTGDVMRAIEDDAIEASEVLCAEFGTCQERLSKLVIERASVRVAIDEGLAVSVRLTELVQDLKRTAKD
jgi:hypothetical protein